MEEIYITKEAISITVLILIIVSYSYFRSWYKRKIKEPVLKEMETGEPYDEDLYGKY